MDKALSQIIISVIAILALIISVTYLGYVPSQSDFGVIISCFTIAFAGYAYLWSRIENIAFKVLLIVSIFIRIVLLFHLPNLSDDIYRFIWDGRMMHIGMNPYLTVPSAIVSTNPLLNTTLYQNLNSQNYYTIYPPIHQLVNYLSTFLYSIDFTIESLLYKLQLLAFDLIFLRIFYLLAKETSVHPNKMFLYFLNPLVIVEVSSNGHFEGVMLCFLALFLYFIFSQKFIYSGLAISMSVAARLLPVMFGPAIICYNTKKANRQLIITGLTFTLVLFIPVCLDFLQFESHTLQSIDLYVKKFEFNAGLYYLLRYTGYLLYGYNMIHILGPAMSLATIIIITLMAIKQKQKSPLSLIMTMLLSFTIFLLLSRTIHPWYLITTIFLCVFGSYRFPLVWSYLITWTYVNYSYEPYYENLLIVAIEYSIVIVILYMEFKRYGIYEKEKRLPTNAESL